MNPSICVIGAEPSGIKATRNLLTQAPGNPVVFEQHGPGANRIFRHQFGQAAVWETPEEHELHGERHSEPKADGP